MSDRSNWQLWKEPLLVWLALLILLGLTVGSAYVSLGILNSIINLVIAAAKVALVAALFMKLTASSVLVRLASIAGLFWLMFLFVMTGADYLTR